MTRDSTAASDRNPGRLCVLTETFHPVRGGGETQARALAAGLAARSWSVLVLTRRSDRDYPRHEVVDGATVLRLPPSGRTRASKWGLSLTALWALLRHRNAYDVVVVCGFRILGIPAVAASLLLNKHCFLKADSLGEMSGDYFAPGLARLGLSLDSFPFGLLLRARNRLLRRADGFVAISSPIEEELVEWGVEPTHVIELPNSVDVDRFRSVDEAAKRSLRRRLGLPEDATVVVYTGRLVTYKGLPMLLDAWRELRGPGRVLALVGAGGMDIHNCEDDLRRYVREHALSESVLFCGEVDNVHQYLQAADIFVLPSENEAFGISLIEAMAVGLPVVSSDAGGLRDIVRDGVDGLRFHAGAAGELVATLARVLADGELRHRLGAEARRTVEERYSQRAVIGRYDRLLRASPRRYEA